MLTQQACWIYVVMFWTIPCMNRGASCPGAAFETCKNVCNIAEVLNNNWIMRKHRLAAIVAAITMGLASLASCNKPDEPVEKEVPVAGITLSQTSVELVEGGSVSISATVTPSNATDKTVTWSSSAADVVSVSEGTITAIKPGTVVVTAKAGGKSATCNVTVLKKTVAVESVSLDKTELSLVEGESASLAAAVLPENATDRSVSWKSSDEVIATVDAQGKVSALKPGTATITVTTTDGGKTAQCVVEIKAKYIAVTGIALDKESATLQVGESLMLTASVSPDNATEPEVTWTVSDSGILQNDGNGSFKALSVGEAIVTAKAGDKTATCEITVVATPVTSVTLNQTSASLKAGETVTLTATVNPSDATDKTVTWTTSDAAVATVDNGVVTAKKVGNAIITAKAGDKTATCAITVEPILVTSVSLDKTSLKMIEGDSQTLIATVYPNNATNRKVTWTSSNSSIVKVDQNGKITAVKAGTASITVTTEDGGKTATCNITVDKKPNVEDPEEGDDWGWD